MSDTNPLLSHEDVAKLVSSMTNDGSAPLTELQAERFLNALTRLQSNVPTAVNRTNDNASR